MLIYLHCYYTRRAVCQCMLFDCCFVENFKKVLTTDVMPVYCDACTNVRVDCVDDVFKYVLVKKSNDFKLLAGV